MQKKFLSVILACAIVLSLGIFAKTILEKNNLWAQETRYGATLSASTYLSFFQVAENKIGFFDSRDNKIYVYDLNANRCEKILQLQAPGSPLLELRKY